MKPTKGSRPSPALIVGVLALVVALGGTALATPEFATKKMHDSKIRKIAKKQAKKQIKKRAPDLSVAHADDADFADEADSAAEADFADEADNADDADSLGGQEPDTFQQQIQWALVEGGANASITAQSGDIELVAQPQAGRYVLEFGASLVDHGIVISPNFEGTDADEVAVAICAPGPGGTNGEANCDGEDDPNQALVEVNNSAGANVNGDFWIAVIE